VHDGLHRGEAAKLAGIDLLVEVQPGTKQDAEWLALSANQKHGLRRSRKDKQRIVRNALLHPYGASLSNREIARHCGVNHRIVGTIRQELELSGEIRQIDKRIVNRGGVTYEQDTGNIGSNQPNWMPVWELEQAVGRWLSNSNEDEATQIGTLEEIKQTTSRGRQFLEQLLTGDILPSPNRKRDVIQACNNILEQLRAASQSTSTDWMTLESSSNWATNGVRADKNGRLNNVSPADYQIEHTPKAQEFECPRCGQEKIVGINGSRRWCLTCGAEWPTAAEFLAEIEATFEQRGTVPTRTNLQQRFSNLLTTLEEQDEQLMQVELWLNELESQLDLSTGGKPTAAIVEPILTVHSSRIPENA